MKICPSSELEQALADVERIKRTYTQPDQQQYLTLLVKAWEYHIAVLRKEQSCQPRNPPTN